MSKANDWIQVFSGNQFHFLDLTPDQIHANGIAHALAGNCRYANHTRYHYSVAEHCVILAEHAMATIGDLDLALWALLHDATEAYIPDIPRPLKNLPGMEAFSELEAKIMVTIAERFQLKGREIPEWVDKHDKLILHDEALQVMPHPPINNWHMRWAPGIGAKINFWDRNQAEAAYFATLADLLSQRINRDAAFA